MTVTVGELVEHLFAAFPPGDAAEWDNCGLSAGDPATAVTGVHIALDPSALSIAEARELGANVLLTHHPAFLGSLESVVPSGASSSVFEALRSNVALIAMHTNLDRSAAVRELLPALVGAGYIEPLEGAAFPDALPESRYGQLSRAAEGDTLGAIAKRAAFAFGVAPRVWGDPERPVDFVATATGSGGSLIDDAIASGADVLIAGELRYHDALSAYESGLSLIELGHDASETCMLPILRDAVLDYPGIEPSRVTVSTHSSSWWTAT